jgi:chromosome partitioning protein
MTALRERLDEVQAAFDVVVVDTSPTQSLLHAMIDMVADYVIYPTKCEELSLQGLADSTRTVIGSEKNRKAQNLPPIKLIGVLPTMFRETRAHMHGISLIEDHFGADKVLPALAERTIWADQSYARQTLFRYAPVHEVTAEVWKLVQRVAKHVAA